MTTDSTTPVDETTLFLGEAWSDPIEAGIRDRIRGFIEQLIEEELAVALGRGGTNADICQATLRTDPLATIRTGPSLVMMLVQVVHGRDPRGAQRLSRGWRSEAREGPVDP